MTDNLALAYVTYRESLESQSLGTRTISCFDNLPIARVTDRESIESQSLATCDI